MKLNLIKKTAYCIALFISIFGIYYYLGMEKFLKYFMYLGYSVDPESSIYRLPLLPLLTLFTVFMFYIFEEKNNDDPLSNGIFWYFSSGFCAGAVMTLLTSTLFFGALVILKWCMNRILNFL